MPPALTASDLAGLWVVAGAGRGVAGACPARVGTGREGRRQCPVPLEPRSAPAWTCDTLRAGCGRDSARSAFTQ